MQKNSCLLKYVVFVSFIILLTSICFICFDIKNTNQIIKANENEICQNIIIPNSTKTDLIRYEIQDDTQTFTQNFASNVSPSNVRFEYSNSSSNSINVIINFVNYQNDYSNYFSPSEISTILSNLSNYVNKYFGIMSYNKFSVNFDYVVHTTSYSYNDLLTSSASSSIENSIFDAGLSACLNEYGNSKTLNFSVYNQKINIFAGDAGEWNTFLWPHAWGSQYYPILLMENNCEANTFLHENFHFLGLPDLYPYGDSNKGEATDVGVGNLDMMCYSYDYPVLNSYYREKLGWLEQSTYGDSSITPLEVISNKAGNINLTVYKNTTTTTNTIAYKFGENTSKNEFFIVEYRVENDQGINLNRNSGVVIYRVHTDTDGNSNAHKENSYAEIVFMGNLSLGVKNSGYVSSCIYSAGSTCSSLVYTNGIGFSNIINGENSGITVRVVSTYSNYANIVISIPKIEIDMSQVVWNYNSSSNFVFNGNYFEVNLLNLDSNIFSAVYSGTRRELYAGNYTTYLNLQYDTSTYTLKNCNFAYTLNWQINKKVLYASSFSWNYGVAFQYNGLYREVYLIDYYPMLTYNYQQNSYKNVGNYTASASFDYPSNTYIIYGINPTLEWQITKANLAIKIDDKTSEYGKSFKTFSFTVTSISKIYNNDDIGINYNKASGNNVGTYEITATCSNTNYNINITYGRYTITPASLEITIDDKSSMFGESLKELTYTKTAGTIYNDDNLNIVLTKASGNNVGTYAITGGHSNNNYTITFTPGTYTITSGEIGYNITNTEYVYDGTYHWITVNVTNPTSYTIKYSLDNINFTTSPIQNNDFRNVNNGKLIYVKIEATGCATINTTSTLTITPASLEITIDDKTSVYGESLKELTYTKTAGTIYNDDNLNIVLTKASGNNVGTYAITGGHSNNNYTVSFTPGTYTITSGEIGYNITNTEYVYDGTYHWITVNVTNPTSYTIKYSLDNINFTTSPIQNNDFRNVNNGKLIYIKIEATACATINTTSTLTITPASLEITIDDKTSVYGESLKELTYTKTAGTIYNDDNLNIVLTKASGNNVGTYAITGGHSNNNYTITITPGTYTITSGEVDYNITNTEYVYDGAYHWITVNVTNPTSYTIKYSLDNVSFTTSQIEDDSLKNVNNGQLIYIKIEATGCATISTTSTLTISPASLEITIDDKTSVYGEVQKTLTYTKTDGTIYNDDDLKIVLSKSAENTVNNYNITGVCNNANYAVNFQNGVYSITPANLSFKIDDKTSVYGENLEELTYSINSGRIYNNDNLNIKIKKSLGTNVGEYKITLTIFNKNYKATVINGTYEITKREIAVILKDQKRNINQDIIIDQTKYTLDLSKGYSILYYDLEDVVISTKESDISKEGEYELQFAINNNNYEVVSIEKAKLIVENNTKTIIIVSVSVAGGGGIFYFVFRYIRIRSMKFW